MNNNYFSSGGNTAYNPNGDNNATNINDKFNNDTNLNEKYSNSSSPHNYRSPNNFNSRSESGKGNYYIY